MHKLQVCFASNNLRNAIDCNAPYDFTFLLGLCEFQMRDFS